MLGDLDPGAGLQRLERLAGQQAVVVDDRRREVDAVVGHVGVAPLDELGR